MALYNRTKTTYQETQSHNPLLLSPSDNGVDWIVAETYVYEVGKIGSGDKITVLQGFITDFATIPRPFWSILPPWGKYGKAAIVHDYLYDYATRSRKESDLIFLEIMGNSGVNTLIKYIIYYCVRAFGWIFYNRKDKPTRKHIVQQKQNTDNDNSRKKFWLILIIGSIMTVVSPWLFTQHWFGHLFKFGEVTGPIGDTIGGLTAPIIGLMSAILIYLTLHEQVKANAKQSEENILSQELAELREGINNIEKYMTEKVYTPTGIDIRPMRQTAFTTNYCNLTTYLSENQLNDIEKAKLFAVLTVNLSSLVDLFYNIEIDKNSALSRAIVNRLITVYTTHFIKVIDEFNNERNTLIEEDSSWEDFIIKIEAQNSNICKKLKIN